MIDGGQKMYEGEVIVKPGFYWIKHKPDSRWYPVEFDGIFWQKGDGSGYDFYMIGPRIREPVH
jgi:hypothetical protein